MKKTFTTLLLLAMMGVTLFAQSPKREMRAVWFTTWLSDFTSTRVPVFNGSNQAARETAITTQKNSLITSLNNLQKENINVVLFHVRPFCDAIYKSSYEPWSQYISAQRGSDPGWDPLEFVIEEAHKRGMELHPWLNPYRYSTNSDFRNTPLDYVNTHPDWLLNYSSTNRCLNPGKPEVIQRIADVIGEIVTNYDVDGIVFDDYFYMDLPHPDAIDQAEYDLYNPDKLTRNDWRRANVNKMVRAVYDRIQSIKPHVTFGISPAGVAGGGVSNPSVATKYGMPPVPVGTDWQYNQIFSDPLAWLFEGSIDYISPQIYKALGNLTFYSRLCEWWSQVSNKLGKHFYSSQDEFSIPSIGDEINYNRDHDLNDAPGSVFFRTTNLTTTTVINYLTANHYRYKALPPAISWKPAPDQDLVENLTLTGQNLKWTHNDSVRYAIYAAPISSTDPLTSSLHLQGISYTYQFTLPSGVGSATHRIAVSAIDRYGNEFSPRVLGESLATPTAAKLISPANNTTVLLPSLFTWEPVTGASGYVWQLARDADFTDVVASRETLEPQFNSGLLGNLKDNTPYYWRVNTLKPNAGPAWSEVRSLTGEFFRILSPNDGDNDISITPTFTWPDMGASANYTIEISKSSQFTEAQQAYLHTLQDVSWAIPAATLMPSTVYYARVKSVIGSFSATSATVKFTTEDLPIPTPQLISPADGAIIVGTNIEACWEEQMSQGFRLEVCTNPNFPSRDIKSKEANAYIYCAVSPELPKDTYYVRVRARIPTGTGFSESSNVARVQLTDEVSIPNLFADENKIFIHRGEGGQSYLRISTPETATASLELISATGMLLSVQETVLSAGVNTIPLDMCASPQGMYILKVKLNNIAKILKFIK